MQKKLIEWIKKQKLIVPGDLILAACSGGPDSVALVHLLAGLRPIFSFKLAVAHVNHLLRGDDSFSDAEFVAEFCKKMQLDFYHTEVDVRLFASANGFSLEEAGRILRYRYLKSLAEKLGGAKIATGHHSDDQAETILLNLLRGAGSSGLSGMPINDKGGIIRPLLVFSRYEIEKYCQANQLQSRTDSTNFSTDYLRNQVRINLLPELAKHYNPGIRELLCRTASIMSEQNDFVQKSAEKLLSEVSAQSGEKTIIAVEKIKAVHIALLREFFRVLIKKKQGHLRGISFYHVEKLIKMVFSCHVGKVFRLPGGLIVQCGYQTIEIEQEHIDNENVDSDFHIELTIPGKTEIHALGLAVFAEILDCWPKENKNTVAVFDHESLSPPLYVRTRLPGDRFWPLGAPGSKKLKSFFIDHKVPATMRGDVPIICDQSGILWVAGYRQAERGKILSSTKFFLQLTIIKTGGIGSC